MLRNLILAAAGAALLAAPAPAAPLQPTTPWNVEYTATKCRAKRMFGDIAFTYEPSLLGTTARFIVAGPGLSSSQSRQYASVIEAGDGGKAIRASSLISPTIFKGQRLVVTYLGNNDLVRVQNGGRYSISAGGGVARADLQLGPMGKLVKAMDTCMADLRKHWGVVDGQVTVPAIPAAGNVSTIFKHDDYPVEAIDNGQDGDVQYVLMIDETGKVAECSLMTKAPAASLSAMGCQVILKRSKFTPARDSTGKAVRSIVLTPVVKYIIQG